MGSKGLFLFLLTGGDEFWVCGQKCADKYNDDETGAYDVKGSVGRCVDTEGLPKIDSTPT